MELFADVPEVLTINDAAALLGVERKTVEREIARGKLKAFKVGRCVRITRPSLAAYVTGERD